MNESTQLSSIPIVSVHMITYNHEKYIAEAIEGVLEQKTSFQFELVIGEDFSTDSTRKICEEYANKYPDIITLLPSDRNLGMHENGIRTVLACRGKYIAACEGDDYWIDPYKLQKQLDYLENNPDYGMVYSKVRVYIEKDKRFKEDCFGKSVSSLDDLLIGNCISTPSVMYRKGLFYDYLKDIDPENKNWLMGDYSFWLYIAYVSKIQYLDYPSSVYRILDKSTSHSNEFMKEKLFIESYHAIKIFYINKLGRDNLENKIWGRYFSNKAYTYLFKNEQNISELLREMNDFKKKSFKIRILKFLLNNWLFRKILKCYWKNDVQYIIKAKKNIMKIIKIK